MAGILSPTEKDMEMGQPSTHERIRSPRVYQKVGASRRLSLAGVSNVRALEGFHRLMTTQDRKVALITGAGSGIGRAVAITLLQQDYTAVLAGRRAEALQETAHLAGAAPGRVLVAPTDVTQPASVDALFATIAQSLGRLDVVFNNAGMAGPGVLFEDITFDQWNAVVALNVTGAFLVAQGAFRLMKAQSPQGGRIINNGSISAATPRVNSAPYTASKHAISGLTKSLSLDGRKYNIACGQIDIGNALTDISAYSQVGAPQASGLTIVEPTMSVDHVGEAVVYMAGLPLNANVQFMTLVATAMPFIGRG
jgi:NAD(P)-dependent dehydrogenase (short-subunit alcohol dehydrogenase family)